MMDVYITEGTICTHVRHGLVRVVRRTGDTVTYTRTYSAYESPDRGSYVVDVTELHAVCPARVHSNYQSHICGREIRGEGLCGLHLNSLRKRRANQEARDAEAARLRGIRQEVQGRIDLLGLPDVTPATDKDGKVVPGTVLVPLEALERLVKRATTGR